MRSPIPSCAVQTAPRHAAGAVAPPIRAARVRRLVLGVAAGLVVCLCAATAHASDYEEYFDAVGDTVLRVTDEFADGVVDPDTHLPPDLKRIVIGSWVPRDAQFDLYRGRWDEGANVPFLRVDVEFDGLVNPPGTLDFDERGPFDPFRFGPNPVFGFIEMDADENVDSGGELATPEYRYLGSAARFGGIPHDNSDLRDRFARWGSEIDRNCLTVPLVEFSGEDFHIAFLGEEYDRHEVVDGDRDAIFESGETWDLFGTWLHRAHGFEGFSFACGRDQGVYDPDSRIRWTHDRNSNTTTVILIFPLNHRGSAKMRGDQRVESFDCDPFNQASIEEAMWDLAESGRFWWNREKDCKRIIVDWGDVDPEDELRPRKWTVNALIGTSYIAKADAPFVWTDVWPDAVPGDVNGDGGVGVGDFRDIYNFVRASDGNRRDGDGKKDGKFTIGDFALDFSVLDVDYDGTIGLLDAGRTTRLGDLDFDRDVDLDDYVLMSICFQGPAIEVSGGCFPVDFDFDGDVDLRDAGRFQEAFTGGG